MGLEHAVCLMPVAEEHGCAHEECCMQCCMVLHGVLHGVICSVARCDMLFQLLSLGNQPTE